MSWAGLLSLEAVLGRKEKGKKNLVLMSVLLLLAGCGRPTQTIMPPAQITLPPAQTEVPSDRTVMPFDRTVLSSEEPESGVQTAEEHAVSVASLLTWEDPDSENLADMLQRECGGMMVQLEAGRFLGSGVLYSADENTLFIVTASHVMADAGGSVKITFVDGWVAESDDFLLWEQTDLAVVRLALEKVPKERLKEYRLVNVDKDACDKLQEADSCIVMGSSSGVACEAYEGIVLEPWIYMEDYGHYMIWVKAYGKPGMSGGGLFDLQGHFLGILSGISEDEEWAVVPLDLLPESL